jgi:hypothetical protein
MRDFLALVLILLVISGILFTWRRSVMVRRRNSHSVRFRLVSSSGDQGPGG